MMELLIVLVFVVGYIAITLEHNIHINKAATALLIGVITWSIYAVFVGSHHEVSDYAQHPNGSVLASVTHQLEYHLPEILNILLFLLGAMTIVELIDMHNGFYVITARIKTRNKIKLLWIIGIITFFLSAVLDNLTTAIVMVSLLRKLIRHREDRLVFAGLVIIAANAGGAWSPIGDVTTTMLWISERISTVNIILELFLPSLICMVVPLIWFSFKYKGEFDGITHQEDTQTTPLERNLMFFAGIGSLIFVPVFKTITHLPPFMGILLGVSIVWILNEFLHHKKSNEEKTQYSILKALSRIDTPSILFFFGILAAVACLSSIGSLGKLARGLDASVGNLDIIVVMMGVLSAIIDNVPLVAAAIQMYPVEQYPIDHKLWEFVAYCAGTGGSMLIIGSAAGVAVMGIERVTFFWYVRNISFAATLGYFAGALVYMLEFWLFAH
jgi:Na+/H+ antiporter NhaD/arsenite permease-like protein